MLSQQPPPESQGGTPQEVRPQCMISYDIQDLTAKQWASWIASQLRVDSLQEPVLVQASWGLGNWSEYLRQMMAQATRVIVILTPGYVTSQDAFVQELCRLTLQEPPEG